MSPPPRGKSPSFWRFAGIEVNGPQPWDIQIHDERFFDRALGEGSIGVGESYMDGWWDVPALDEFFTRFRRADLASHVHDLKTALLVLKTRALNLQTMQRAKQVAQAHYDLGNQLYQAMLDRRMQYTCAYWKDAATLDQAQENKLHLICRKLQLAPGMTLLELGGGFGGLAHFAAKEYGCHVVSYNISREQVAFGRDLCKGLPVRFEQKDYREAARETSRFDRVVSIGLCEHIGYKNYRQFMQLAHGRLKDQGLFLLHTIGSNESYSYTDPWIHKYIFPNGLIPSMAQLTTAWEGVWVAEDWHNFGPDYDRTVIAVVEEFRASVAGPAPDLWRSFLSHVEVLFDGLGGILPLPQASALADRPVEGRHFFLHAGPVGLRSYGSGDGPSEEDRNPRGGDRTGQGAGRADRSS